MSDSCFHAKFLEDYSFLVELGPHKITVVYFSRNATIKHAEKVNFGQPKVLCRYNLLVLLFMQTTESNTSYDNLTLY